MVYTDSYAKYDLAWYFCRDNQLSFLFQLTACIEHGHQLVLRLKTRIT